MDLKDFRFPTKENRNGYWSCSQMNHNGTISISGSPSFDDNGIVNLNISIIDSSDPQGYELNSTIEFEVVTYNLPEFVLIMFL